jgi:hypothetical protein
MATFSFRGVCCVEKEAAFATLIAAIERTGIRNTDSPHHCGSASLPSFQAA